MRKLRVRREFDAPAAALWSLLTDLEAWPRWGPTVRRATLDSARFGLGSRGTVTTMVGLDLRFEVTEFADGAHWGWRVAGVDATDHIVEPLGPDRCAVSFGVPWPLAPYLAVCRLALARLAVLAESERY